MPKLSHALQWLCVAVALWFCIAFIFIAANTLNYPYNLEWMEGQNIDVVQRVLNGQALYTKPSLEYVPFIYTPLYYYLSALIAYVIGIGFFPARLVSLLATLGTGSILFAWIKKENGDWKSAIIGAGLFYATYRLSGRWFDNARVDSLFLFLSLAGLYVYMHYRGKKAEIAAGLILAAAFFTKQSALIIAFPVLAAGCMFDRKHAIPTLGTMLVAIAAGVLVFDALTQDWFSFFVFLLPSGHGQWKNMIVDFWTRDMFRPLGIACATALFFMAFIQQASRKQKANYIVFAASAIGAAYIARIHSYGYINVLMSAHALLALYAGLSLKQPAISKNPFRSCLLHAALLAQLAMLLYNPKPLIPSEKSIETGDLFLQELSKIEGDVFMPELQFVQTRIGKQSYSLGMAAFDLMRADLGERNTIKSAFNQEITQAIASGRFSAVMPGRLVNMPNYKQYYQFSVRLRYPQEYVTGAINFLRTDIFMRIPNTQQPNKSPP